MNQQDFQQTEDNINRYKENITSLAQDFELGLFLYLVNKIKWILVFILIFFFSLSLIYLRYKSEIYKTQAYIQLAVKDEPLEFMMMNPNSSSTNLKSELAIIKSQKLITKLIKELELSIFYYYEGEIISRFLYKSSSYKLDTYSIKDSSLISKKIHIKYENNYFSLVDIERDIVYAEFIEANKYFSSEYLSGIIKIDGELEEFKKNIDNNSSYFIFPAEKQVRNEILNGLEVNIIDKAAHTISISHQHTNGLFSKDICNSLVDIYIDYDLERKQLSSEKIVKFINIRKDSVQKKLILNEKKIRKFQKLNGFNNRTSLKEKQLKEISSVEKELTEINSNIDLLNQFDLMFGNIISSEITSSSIKNISLLTIIFYDDELIKTMINQLQ